MDPGVRTSDTIRVSIETEPRRAELLQALTADSLVAVVAASSRPTRGVVETFMPPSTMSVDQLAVSSEYFKVLGVDLVSGRGFTQPERTVEAGVVVVSETIARQLWPNGEGVGQVVRLEAPQSASPGGVALPARTLTVVGVVRDPGRDSGLFYLETFRGVYLPTSPESPGTWLYLRVRGNPGQTRLALLDRLTGGPSSFHFALRLKHPWRNRFRRMSAAERERFIAEMRERGEGASAFEADPRERLVQFLRDCAQRRFDSRETLESLTLLEDTTDEAKRGGRYLAAFIGGTKMIWTVALTADGGVSFDGTSARA